MIYELRFAVERDGYTALRSILIHSIKPYDLAFCEQFDEDEYAFLINGEAQEVLGFCDEISKRIPLSLNFKFLHFKDIESDDFKPSLVPDLPLVLDASLMQELSSDPNKLPKYLDNFECKDILATLNECINRLKANNLVIKTALGNFKFGVNIEALSKESSQDAKLLFWDISMLKTHMRVESGQVEALASFEKPSMMLMPKEIFCDTLGGGIRECILPFDAFLSVLSAYCLKQDIAFSFFVKSSEEPFVSYDQNLPKSHRIVVSKDGFVLYDEIEAKSLQEIINAHKMELEIKDASKNLQASSLIMFLSKKNKMFFWLRGDGVKSVLDFEFECSLHELFQEILATKDGDKLCENFKKHCPELYLSFQGSNEPTKKSKNIFDFLDSVAFILGFKNVHQLFANAYTYVRDKGPRIDYKIIKNEEDELKFNYILVLKSAMSFKIAGLDDATLCYGILDSLGEFLGNLIGDMGVNFHAKSVFIFGSLLGEKILFDKILHYMPKSMRLILPKSGFLDYQ